MRLSSAKAGKKQKGNAINDSLCVGASPEKIFSLFQKEKFLQGRSCLWRSLFVFYFSTSTGSV
jgi:hypothetical protein